VPSRSLSSTILALAASCTDPEPALYPIDYAATYQEVRNCRFSLEHDLVRIRVLASPDALTAYNGRVEPFPTGAIVLKEQYADSDITCSGPLVEVTVMQKLPIGSAPSELDWKWEKAGADHHLVDFEVRRCRGCHEMCGQPPDGYDGTCTVP
jgi:hypothetical protein